MSDEENSTLHKNRERGSFELVQLWMTDPVGQLA